MGGHTKEMESIIRRFSGISCRISHLCSSVFVCLCLSADWLFLLHFPQANHGGNTVPSLQVGGLADTGTSWKWPNLNFFTREIDGLSVPQLSTSDPVSYI